MSGEFEELVRGSMEWFAGDVRIPAGLAGKARRRHRRRLLAVRAALAAGTAAVVSAAVVIAVTGGASGAPGLHPHSGGAVRARTAAYVIQRAERAVSTSSLIMEISTPEQVITTERPGNRLVKSFVPRSVWWAYHDRSRGEVYAAYLRRHGHPDAADTDTEYGPPGKSIASSPSLHPFTQTTVNYSDRTWSRGTQLTGLASGSAGAACELVKGMTDPLLAGEVFFTSPSFIHAALACGGLSVTGRMRVDGAAAITLTGTQRLAKLPTTLYLSPATYLPIRIVIGGLRQDYRWLAPTAANLAMLKVHIPPRFRHVNNATGPSS
jgi:hypothetical protein